MKIINMICLMALIGGLRAAKKGTAGVDLPKEVKDIVDTLERDLTQAEKDYLTIVENSKNEAIKAFNEIDNEDLPE